MTAITWNPSDKDAAIVLTSTNHVATQSGAASAWRSVRATAGFISTGKWYWEIAVNLRDTSDGWIAGIASSLASLTSFCGSDTRGLGYQTQASAYYNGGGTANQWRGAGNGAVVGFAVDVPNKLLWVANWTADPSGIWNFGLAGSQNPSTNQGGKAVNATIIDGTNTVFPMFSGFNASANDQATINAGDSAFTGTIPTGFTSLDGSQSGGGGSAQLYRGPGSAGKLVTC
jgi:hypothetical protein